MIIATLTPLTAQMTAGERALAHAQFGHVLDLSKQMKHGSFPSSLMGPWSEHVLAGTRMLEQGAARIAAAEDARAAAKLVAELTTIGANARGMAYSSGTITDMDAVVKLIATVHQATKPA